MIDWLLRRDLVWRSGLGRLILWIACRCRKEGVWSATGGRCDVCGRAVKQAPQDRQPDA